MANTTVTLIVVTLQVNILCIKLCIYIFVLFSELALPPTWPDQGRISFQDVNLKYAPDEAPVLKNLNLTIESGWKVC